MAWIHDNVSSPILWAAVDIHTFLAECDTPHIISRSLMSFNLFGLYKDYFRLGFIFSSFHALSAASSGCCGGCCSVWVMEILMSVRINYWLDQKARHMCPRMPSGILIIALGLPALFLLTGIWEVTRVWGPLRRLIIENYDFLLFQW